MSRDTLRSLGWALFGGVLFAISPFTPDDLVPSIIAGFVAGALVLVYRLFIRRPSVDAAAVAADRPVAAPRPPLSFWLVMFLCCAVFAPTAGWLYRQWTASVWQNDHGLLTPFVMAYLAHSILRKDTRPENDSSPWGLLVVFAGLSLVVIDGAIRTEYLSAIGLVLCLPGLSLLFLGWRRTRAIALPLFLGIFMIPIPNVVTTHLYLQTVTAVSIEPLIELVGIPVFRDHLILTTSQREFVISEACSGYASLYAAVAASVVLAFYCKSNLRRAVLLLAAPPLALTANTVRVFSLVLLTELVGPWIMDTVVHPASGVAVFFVVLGALFLLADRETLREGLA